MTTHHRAATALKHAVDALQEAATELTIAAVLCPAGSAASNDAMVLAQAVELEVSAGTSVLLRHLAAQGRGRT